MKSLDRYLDFLISYNKESLLDVFKRFYSYYTFKRTSVNELLDDYKSIYDLLMDFQYLYLKLDLFYNLSGSKEYNDLVQLEVEQSVITSEVKILNDYTTFYTFKFKNYKVPNTMATYEWDDKDRQVIYKPKFGETIFLDNHTSKVLFEEAATYILSTLDYILDRNWKVPNKELNYFSIKIDSMRLIDFHINQSYTMEDYQIKINLDKKCQYIDLGNNKFAEIIPIKAKLSNDDIIYDVDFNLYITYVNYRKEYLKENYNPYIVNLIERNKLSIYKCIESTVKSITRSINLLNNS